MNKQKYLIMGITFLILIAITPFVFSKLMNAKLNKMVENLNKEGYSVKLIKDKSSYLKTDKVFLVDIPGDKLNNQLVDNLKFKIETTFNNLPVTKVDFKGVLEKIDLTAKEYNDEINSLFDKKIKFTAVTPNFKVYDYKLEDINLPVGNAEVNIKGIKGIFEYSDIKNNKLSIDDISFITDNLLIEMKNIRNNSFYKKNNIKNENSFDFYLKVANNNIQINNVKISTNSLIDKKTSVISKISFDKFISNFLNMDNFMFNINVLNLDTPALIAVANEIDPQKRDLLTLNLLKKGLEINLQSQAEKIEVMNKSLGFYLVDANLKVLPDPNLQEDIKTNNLKFLDSTIHYESTPEIATLFMNLFPKSAFLFALAKKTNGKVILDISLKNSKLLINGEEVK
ncbi:conserved hypothetical protein [Lebetimonas natsushimae]|uniref:DUF945 domain-containing protein n=1 Tax=Lebetimonas natsushimae TaxID=1936991 RepID=A0A292YCT4_9BACT|nr:hypothetical protein [Lebetimonas natsushimae]GAX87827.1 conserved hypothetical protein [Lebetimonas natsushimae]